MKPKFPNKNNVNLQVYQAESAVLLCPAQGFPVPFQRYGFQ